MTRALAVLVAVLASAGVGAVRADAGRPTTGRTDIWQRTIDPGAGATTDAYQREMREGDEHVAIAATRSGSLMTVREQVQQALQSYRNAAKARPAAAEPYFRIANVLWSFYLQSCDGDVRRGSSRSPLADCTAPDQVNVPIAEHAIAAWDAFEARAPLDPRLSSGLGSILFSRAIVHTKLATRPHLEGAARDYEAIIRRSDGRSEIASLVWGNLAETYMMLGRLDESVHAYQEALRTGAQISTWYGLAVALDRDGRGDLARKVIVAQQGRRGYLQFREGVDELNTFFVPHGEVFYYYALAEEALGQIDEALRYWNQYIASGAHPQYHRRAKEHVDALLAKKRAGIALPKLPRELLDLR